ncbi:DNA-binding CsgD family transcriptional regulator [Pararhizobium capsulatum DSM 1112]|uniref:DNA-binding CsgD family transcriptional regulator n=1 Tax=Pararhizobium capsulatum DSM 1112 TaxID=1121113 RepID=A0ABU0C1V1_9HYPH|nr:LuxR family transcriptional regulator [Pararhizobium capsulatum]MDQ0323092.1 DNA-binding CsgD family transcriptional regulator [Pararhizobium capsulatum DSM 1112]
MNKSGQEMPQISSALRALRSIGSSEHFAVVLDKIRSQYLLDHMTFLIVNDGISPRTFPFYCTTYPPEWTDIYLSRNYFVVDPVTELSRTGFLPVDWSELKRRSAEAQVFFKQARSWGIGRHGLSLPVRGPNGERSILSVTSNADGTAWSRIRNSRIHDLHVLAHCLHEKAIFLSNRRSGCAYRTLSRREKQCLELLAQGRLIKRVASDLGISESAVRLYLRSARGKLGATTLYQTIAKASFLEKICI